MARDIGIIVFVLLCLMFVMVLKVKADTTCTTNWYCDDWGNCSAVTDCYDY